MFRQKSNVSGRNMEDDDEVDNDDEEEVEDMRNEPPPQTLNNRRRNTGDDKHDITPGRIVHSNPSMSKSQLIRVLDANRNFSIREVKAKHKILAIKCHPDK